MWTIFIATLALASSQECSDPNCLSCEVYSGEEFCSLCSNGLFASYSQCSPCESQPLECELSSSKWTCFCASTLSMGTIEPNPSLSGHCIEGQPCQICFEGFVYEDGNCLKIDEDLTLGNRNLQSLPYKCAVASAANPLLCNTCEDGYFAINGYCYQCDATCKTCSDQYKCTSCNSPLVVENNKKSCCVVGCSDCYYGTCLACGSGYTYNNYNCVTGVTCPSDCSSCDSTGKCLGCKSGKQYNDVSFSCETCPSNCGNCPNGACSAPASCPTNCNTCDSTGKCTQCSWGYGETTTPGVCSKCDGGYYPVSSGCDKCVSTCTACDWKDSCTGCVSGYSVISGYCCAAGCKSCSHTTCFECNSGYLISNGACGSCPANCGGCPNGYCQLTCPTNCNTCDSAGQCTQCSWGYGVTTTPGVCSKCDGGYYPISGGCDKCVSTCTACDWKDSCTGCVSGYSLISGYCCAAGCKSCSHTTCFECNSGYKISNGACGSCPANCGGCPFGYCQLTCPTECSSCTETACTGCNAGYSLVGSNCVKCPDNCLSCISTTICSTCQDGYYKSSGSCPACNPKCKTCSALNRCLTCVSNYEIASSTVKKCCLVGCSDCNMSNDNCSSCKSGYNYISSSMKCVAV